MPGSAREVKNAEGRRVEFIWLSSPKQFIGDKMLMKLKSIKMS